MKILRAIPLLFLFATLAWSRGAALETPTEACGDASTIAVKSQASSHGLLSQLPAETMASVAEPTGMPSVGAEGMIAENPGASSASSETTKIRSDSATPRDCLKQLEATGFNLQKRQLDIGSMNVLKGLIDLKELQGAASCVSTETAEAFGSFVGGVNQATEQATQAAGEAETPPRWNDEDRPHPKR